MADRTLDDLRQKQAAPLGVKLRLTMARVREWVNEYGEDGVYVSFSGGKDSTVLLDIVRNRMGYKNIPAMFVDVPTQYPELKAFVQTFDNVDIVKPNITFMKVCEKYGFPLISKEVSECVQGARKYLREIVDRQTDRQTDREYLTDISSINFQELATILNERMKSKSGGSNQRLAIMLGLFTRNKDNPIQANIPEQDRSNFSQTKYKYFLEAPFEISNQCCNAMKKNPAHRYHKDTGRNPITAQMADESRLRTQKWIQNGCNGFHLKIPTSNPMSFWTENDVLEYIYENNLEICSVYGHVVKDTECDGQMDITDYLDCEMRQKYRTTGCERTGCMLCGFGCHMEKNPNRFEMLRETHPKMYALLDVVKNNGVTFREAIEWTNEHGNLDIRL